MTHMPGRVVPWVVAVCLAGATVLAQQTFKSTTSLLTLDVSVLDSDGNPVTGLGPDDFVVTLNKETRPVRTMVFLATESRSTTKTVRGSSPGSPESPPPAAAPESNREPDAKLLVIMVDDMSIYPTDSKGLFVAAERFIDTIPTQDWVGLASTSGRMTVNPSLDRAPLMKELRHTFGWMNDPRRETKPFLGFMDALEADASSGALLDLIRTRCGADDSKNLAQLLAENSCASEMERKARDNARVARVNTRNQLDNYAAVIGAMASAPGVKQLVILTGGIALKPSDAADFIPVAHAAVAAGVQITMLMEDPDPDMSMESPGLWVKDQQRMLQQVQTLAEVSGGQFFRVIGQADRFYQRVLTSASAIYRLGVDLPESAPADGNYKVAVTVTRPGVRVLASRYAAPPAQAAATADTVPPTAGTPEVVGPDRVPTVTRRTAVDAILAKAGAYLESYEKAFSVVVSEESYYQELRVPPRLSTRPVNTAQEPPQEVSRTLHADVLQASVGQREWVAFRDVYEVNGQAVRDRDERLQTLFLQASPDTLDQARRILSESSRYNLGSLQRDLNVPTMALTYLRASNQSRSEFSLDGTKDIDGVRSVVLKFKEHATPTVIRSGESDLPATGRFWIEPESGRVLKTEISFSSRRSGGKITVTYGTVPELTVWVPVAMTEEYSGAERIYAKATYSKFRQFGVSVDIK